MLQASGPRLCPFQPPSYAHIGFALVAVLSLQPTPPSDPGTSQDTQAGPQGPAGGRSERGAEAWDLEAPPSLLAHVTPLRRGSVAVSLHDARTSWPCGQTLNQAGLSEAEGAVHLYRSLEEAVLRTPPAGVARGVEGVRRRAGETLRADALALHVGVFKAW